MGRAQVARLVCLAAAAALAWLPVAPASADLVTPPGACTGSGEFQSTGVSYTSTALQPSDVVLIPQQDTVRWIGQEHGEPIGHVGPSRQIKGDLSLELPGDVAAVNIWSWGPSQSTKYANQGLEHYSVPSALVGVKLKLVGHEVEAGAPVCSGSVYVEVSGSVTSNPVGYTSGGLGLLALLALVLAGVRHRRVLGPVAGFLLGLCASLALTVYAGVPTNSALYFVLPAAGLIGGIVWPRLGTSYAKAH